MQKKRLLKDKVAAAGMSFFAYGVIFLIFLMIVALWGRSRQILSIRPLSELLLGSSWHPMKGEFGLYPFIAGTIWVTMVGMALAVPLSLLTALYLSEYAPRVIRETTAPLIDLLAGIPSVVYGVWGVLVVVPVIRDCIAPFLGVATTGYSVLAGGIVLAIMVVPIIIHVAVEVFRTVPSEMREASLALGATRWQTVKHVLLRKAFPGVVAAVGLGFSRAFGETMAVLMVTGNLARVPSSVFDAAYPLPALIANSYGEMLSIPLYDSSLMLAAFVLLVVVLVFTVASRVVLLRVEGR